METSATPWGTYVEAPENDFIDAMPAGRMVAGVRRAGRGGARRGEEEEEVVEPLEEVTQARHDEEEAAVDF